MSQLKTNINTQKEFFKCITPNILNNLLQFVDSNKFAEDIVKKRNEKNLSNNLHVKSFIYDDNKTNPLHPSNMTIHVEVKQNNIEYFHLSIHLCPNSFKNTTKKRKSPAKGPIHFIQDRDITNKNKVPSIIVRVITEPNKPRSLQFVVGNIQNQDKMSPELLQDAKVILDVLNEYFDETNSEKYINTYITNKHPNFNKTIRNMNSELRRAQVQRNNQSQKYENINISGKRDLRTQSSRRKTRRNNGKTE